MVPEKITMKQIAKKTGHSVATVSRVFNGSGYPVKKETKDEILTAASELGYEHKQQNRTIRWEDHQNISNVISVIVPTITNQHYTLLLQGIEEYAYKNNYNIMLCNVNREPQKEIDFIRATMQRGIRGIIIASTTGSLESLERYLEKGNFVVAVEQDIPIACDKINYNYLKSGFIAAEYLANLGHKRIAFFSSPATRHSRIELQKGFIAGLKNKGYMDEDILLYISEDEKELSGDVYEHLNGCTLAEKMLSDNKKPTAIFCINDMTAIGASQQLQLAGYRVPEDISIMGFDNIPYTKMVIPKLTTIDQSSFDLGYIACESLIKKITGETKNNISLSFEPILVERASTSQIII